MRNCTDTWNTLIDVSSCTPRDNLHAYGSAINLSVSLMIRFGNAIIETLPFCGVHRRCGDSLDLFRGVPAYGDDAREVAEAQAEKRSWEEASPVDYGE